jgi:DNA-binding transcriptional LysR family regulator
VEFDDIRAFVAVAEARSVSRAARELYLTQPAVTRRVQRLEGRYGGAPRRSSRPSSKRSTAR